MIEPIGRIRARAESRKPDNIRFWQVSGTHQVEVFERGKLIEVMTLNNFLRVSELLSEKEVELYDLRDNKYREAIIDMVSDQYGWSRKTSYLYIVHTMHLAGLVNTGDNITFEEV